MLTLFGREISFLAMGCDEITHGDSAVYVSEFRGVSPCNKKLLKSKWNFVRDC